MRYTVFLLECKENEERQANFPSKEASQSISEITSFANGAIITEF